jgi:hypothetical protein
VRKAAPPAKRKVIGSEESLDGMGIRRTQSPMAYSEAALSSDAVATSRVVALSKRANTCSWPFNARIRTRTA